MKCVTNALNVQAPGRHDKLSLGQGVIAQSIIKSVALKASLIKLIGTLRLELDAE